MKNKIIVLILFIILTNYLQTKPLNINPSRINCYYMMDFVKVNNSLYILGKTDFKVNAIELFKLENDVITKVPFIINGKEVKLITDKFILKKDNEGNIYLLADGIYKFNGNSWEVIKINDEMESKRTYYNLEIAKDNSIWFVTRLKFSETEELKTTLYRYIDGNFDNVYERVNTVLIKTLKALDNGSMLMQRMFNRGNKSDNAEFFIDNNLKEDIKELYYWDNNLNLTTETLVSSSGYDFINHNKKTNFIEEDGNILKFGFTANIYPEYIEGTNFNGCCGGYIEKINNEWLIYDTTKGIAFNDNSYIDMKAIYSLKDHTFLFWDNDLYSKIYYKQGTNSFDTLKVSNLLENSEYLYIREIEDNNKGRFTTDLALNVYKTIEIDNYVYLCNQQYITKISKNFFQNITSIETDQKIELLYPNPAKNTLSISKEVFGNNSNLKFAIYNTTGNLLIENSLQSNLIDVANLTTGVYYLTLKSDNKIINYKFIKE